MKVIILSLEHPPNGQPDWQLDVIHTPGHANDHICYLEKRLKAYPIKDPLHFS